MKKITPILLALSSFLVFTGCKKDKEDTLEGNYTGTFRVVYSTGTKTGPVSVQFSGSGYSSSHNPDRIPAGGSGSFSRTDSKISFSDRNYWTTDFDGNLILNETYDYTFDGNTLVIFGHKNGVGYYEYMLKKE